MLHNSFKTVVVGMSGGVDSSVSAYLLKKQGYNVIGLFMNNWIADNNDTYCAAASDFMDAQLVCNKLNIVLHTINFSDEYWNNVFKNFLSEYKIGRTPNPDILCNKKIKFKAFLEFAIENLEADFIATGHYVRCNTVNGNKQLLRGIDDNKDQSYFLYTLNQTQLLYSLFPIGNLTKITVRKIATRIGLITAQKKDSTGICFIGKKNFRNFLSNYFPPKIGFIISVDGIILGKHIGLMYYTLGQRKGLGIGGLKQKNNIPWYVVEKDVKNNILIVAQGNKHPSLMSTGCIVKNIHWINPYEFENIKHCTCKIRYRHPDIPCNIIKMNNKLNLIEFSYPIIAVTPGQSIVFYYDEICLGGGIIENRIQ